MNSYFRAFNNNCIFCVGILLAKSITLHGSNVKQFQGYINQDQKKGRNIVYFGPETTKTEYKGSEHRIGKCINRNTSFEA